MKFIESFLFEKRRFCGRARGGRKFFRTRRKFESSKVSQIYYLFIIDFLWFFLTSVLVVVFVRLKQRFRANNHPCRRSKTKDCGRANPSLCVCAASYWRAPYTVRHHVWRARRAWKLYCRWETRTNQEWSTAS